MRCNNMMAIAIRSTVLFFLLINISSVHGARVLYTDGGAHVIEEDYEAHNIFIVNGTTVSLENGSITAPDTGDDGEDAVRVEDATFQAISGKISGGLGIAGTGVTISTTRDSDHPPGSAIFEAGVEVYGGDATREKTTKGGDAVQILQSGSIATFNGGRFVPGTGCTIKVCGTATDDGVALQVIQGKAIVKGGTFEGVLYNLGGDIELHGCVVYAEDTQKITGVLLDGSNIDVMYSQPKDQNGAPVIVYDAEVCPTEAPESTPLSNTGRKTMNSVALVRASSVLSIIFATLQ